MVLFQLSYVTIFSGPQGNRTLHTRLAGPGRLLGTWQPKIHFYGMITNWITSIIVGGLGIAPRFPDFQSSALTNSASDPYKTKRCWFFNQHHFNRFYLNPIYRDVGPLLLAAPAKPKCCHLQPLFWRFKRATNLFCLRVNILNLSFCLILFIFFIFENPTFSLISGTNITIFKPSSTKMLLVVRGDGRTRTRSGFYTIT